MIRSLSLLFARPSCLVKLDFYNANSLIPNSMSRHITPLVNIIQTLSQLVFTRVQRRNTNQFYCSWFESTGDCTHNHHCCCFLSVYTMFFFLYDWPFLHFTQWSLAENKGYDWFWDSSTSHFQTNEKPKGTTFPSLIAVVVSSCHKVVAFYLLFGLFKCNIDCCLTSWE
jgi:hypothetical protein